METKTENTQVENLRHIERPKGMTDKNGQFIPDKYIKPWDKFRNKCVMKIWKRWHLERFSLESLHKETLKTFDELIAEREKEIGAPLPKRGNISFISFDGLTKMEMSQRWLTAVDERIAAAKQIMLDYCRSLTGKLESGESRDMLEQLIAAAFDTRKSGDLSVAKVITLTKLRVKSAEWQRAVEMLKDALNSERGKRYITVSRRASREDDFVSVRLDIADCWPAPDGTEV